MNTSFDCPICKDSDWTVFSTISFEKSKLTESSIHSKKYQLARKKVLFEKWFPGQDVVKLSVIHCKSCGFVCYTPRPTEEDISAKYIFLNDFSNQHARSTITPRLLRLKQKRAAFVYQQTSSNGSSKQRSILDVGGGTGELLKYFLDKDKCYLIDYNPDPVKGVTKIANSFAEMEPDQHFDVLLCSHVLEHVVDPVGFAGKIHCLMTDTSVAYFEVPMEIWQGVPIVNDPVTHINFFTLKSLEATLKRAGFTINKIEYRHRPYGEKYKRVIFAVVSKGVEAEAHSFTSNTETYKLLHPGKTLKAGRLIENLWIHGVLNAPVTLKSVLKKLK